MSLEKVTLIGAGPVGCLLALQLARRGYEVEIFESRPDIRKAKIPAGRSINLALSLRGIHALSVIGIEREILASAIPMLGREIHDLNGHCQFQPYGVDESQYINSISRAELNRALLNAAESEKNCTIHFEHRLLNYEVEARRLHFSSPSGQSTSLVTETVIGCDGSASALRESLVKHGDIQCEEESLGYGYKELTVPAGPNGSFQLKKQALHIWPRGKFMFITLPNLDGSFTGTLFLPLHGENSFEFFTEDEKGRRWVREFFDRNFKDVASLIPDLENAALTNPLGKLITVKTKPWHLGGQALLIGDAAHAIVPFYGQGLNCSFEDCTLLDEALAQENNLNAAIEKFSLARKVDGDAIAQLAQDHFAEMRDRVAQPRFLLEKEIEVKLMREFPDLYRSRYSLVTFSRQPYSQALRAGRAQDKILAQLSENLQSVKDLDLELAKRLIQEHRQELGSF